MLALHRSLYCLAYELFKHPVDRPTDRPTSLRSGPAAAQIENYVSPPFKMFRGWLASSLPIAAAAGLQRRGILYDRLRSDPFFSSLSHPVIFRTGRDTQPKLHRACRTQTCQCGRKVISMASTARYTPRY